jgi:hypothetical protein
VRAAALLVVLSLAAALSACGDLSGRYRPSQIVPPPRVDERTLARYPAGSPQRAILGWYGTLQRGDAAALRPYYSSRTPFMHPTALRFQVAQARPFFHRVSLGPLAVDTVRPGSATIVTDLRVRWEAQNGRAQELRSPQSFTLVRERGRWRFADTYFLRFASHFKPQKPVPGW